MERRVDQLLKRFKELEEALSSPDTVLDQKLYRQLTQEYSYLMELKDEWNHYLKIKSAIDANTALLMSEKDPELIEIIKEDLSSLQIEAEEYKRRIENILVPPDPRDSRDVILELRAGTGGEEAALFVADCVRMYQNYATKRGWKFDTISSAYSDLGGYKEYIAAISGKDVFRLMQYEAGTHRVQRVPATETQGRVHTSAITVAVLMEPTAEEVKIEDKDLKIDTYRASGAGGQHINVTDSAVRITHLPTGVVVACQEERSQHKNKDKAMRILSAKIAEEMQKKQQKEQAVLRSTQIGTGDRSEKIRTYNFPQNRLTDHRIDLTLYKLDRIMEGDLDDITTALVTFYYKEKVSGK